jgi:hypothetical protein
VHTYIVELMVASMPAIKIQELIVMFIIYKIFRLNWIWSMVPWLNTNLFMTLEVYFVMYSIEYTSILNICIELNIIINPSIATLLHITCLMHCYKLCVLEFALWGTPLGYASPNGNLMMWLDVFHQWSTLLRRLWVKRLAHPRSLRDSV